jgi:hypothetical protein
VSKGDNLVDRFFEARAAIFAHVGYDENWRVLPIDDSRDDFWAVDENEHAWVKFSPKREALVSWLVGPDGEFRDYSDVLYENRIYTQRHLSKWVYRGAELTLVVVDTQTDGNKLLRIFRNANEVKVDSAVNEAIDHMLTADQTSSAKDRLASVRALCKQIPISTLRAAIGVHRTNCHQSDCPVLAAMVENAATRRAVS